MGWWWIFERGRASGEGAGTGACVWGGGGEGVRIWAFWLWDFGIIKDPAARRATLVDRLRDGQDDEQGHAVEKLAEWDDFGAHFGPPLDRIGIPACVF